MLDKLNKLEIGPSNSINPGFVTVDIDPRKKPDYLIDASGKLPFKDEQFELIYASHIIEHIPWYKTEKTLIEWVRVLKYGGKLEVHTVNAVIIAKWILLAEEGKVKDIPDRWAKFNPEHNPFKWASARMFAYDNGEPNWHKALFTPRYLFALFEKVGLINLEALTCRDLRSSKHGLIDFGVRGTKVRT